MGKPWWLSKTLWLNALALLGSVATAMGLDVGPELQAQVVGGVLAVANIGMRIITKEPLKSGKQSGAD